MRLPAPAFTRALRPLAAGCVLLALAACGTAEEDAAPAPADTLAAQPDRPLLDPGSITLVERFRLAPDAEAALQRPIDLGTDPAGSLYVLDAADTMRIARLDSAGGLAMRFDRLEPGVARIGRATQMSVSSWNTVLLVDRAANTLTTYITLGTFTGAVEIQGGIAIGVRALPSFGEFYLHKWAPSRGQAYVIRGRTPLDSLGTVYSVAIPPGQDVRKEARDVGFETAVDAQGRLYVGFADAYPVRVLSPAGQTVRLVGIDREAVPRTEAEMARERAEIEARIRSALPDVADTLVAEAAVPEPVHPLVEELDVDPAGRLWVRTHRPDAAGATPFDVFNEAGQYMARVDVPGDVRRAAFGPDGTLYGIVEGEGGERTIVGWDVALGEPAAGSGEAPATTSGDGPGTPSETVPLDD